MSITQTIQVTGSLDEALAEIVGYFGAHTGTVHCLAEDGCLHLAAATGSLPAPVLDPAGLLNGVPELKTRLPTGAGALATLDDATWTATGLEIWRGWPDVTRAGLPSAAPKDRAQPEP